MELHISQPFKSTQIYSFGNSMLEVGNYNKILQVRLEFKLEINKEKEDD